MNSNENQPNRSTESRLNDEFENYYKLCRLCATPIDLNEYYIYTNEELPLSLKINCCLPITVDINDGYPDIICEYCKNNLEKTYNFVNKVVAADNVLKSKYKSNHPNNGPNESKQENIILQTNNLDIEMRNTENGESDSNNSHSYICHVCGKMFKIKQLLDFHNETHNDLIVSEVFTCNICNEVFTTSEMCELHKNTHEETPEIKNVLTSMVFKCEYCEKKYLSSNKLIYHKKSNHVIQIFSCEICNVNFSTINRRDDHKRIHSKEIESTNRSNIITHFICEFCGKSYLYYDYLNVHKKLKHKKSKTLYTCQKCKEVFPKAEALSSHYHNKHNYTFFPCPEKGCSSKFKDSTLLKKHLNSRHAPPAVCSQCGKIFLNKLTLKQHIETNHIELAHVCEICGLIFSTDKSFQRHRYVHLSVTPSGTQSNSCVICKKQFNYKFEIQKHMRCKHSGNFKLLIDLEEDSVKSTHKSDSSDGCK